MRETISISGESDALDISWTLRPREKIFECRQGHSIRKALLRSHYKSL
jgi:hypothetical protein